MKAVFLKRSSTVILRIALFLAGLFVLGLCMLVLPTEAKLPDGTYPPLFWAMYAAAVPFFVALFYAFKLLGYIDTNKAFTAASVAALNYIKYCAIAIGLIYTPFLPHMYTIAQQEDAPGAFMIGLFLAFAPLVAAVFVAVLQKLLQSAIAIKSENDLTV